MRKIRKLSLFVILGIVICALIFIGISSLEANSIGEKPDKPPGKPDKPEKPVKPPPEEEVNWAVRIPTSGSGYMFYGIGDGIYENNDSSIKVSVEKNSPGAWKRYFNFVYDFDFTLTNENAGSGTQPAYQVGFQNVGGLEVINGVPTNRFPSADIVTFLNGTHPHAGGIEGEEDYQFFWTRIHVFDHDIESMQPGEIYVFGDGPDAGEPGDYLSIIARYQQECYPEPAYHDVELYRNINWARAQENGNPQNIMIERKDATPYEAEYGIECDGVWRIWVSYTGYAGLPNGYLKVKERYCTIEKNKTKWYYPMEAKGNFNFYIDFIKNPTTE